MLVLLAVCECKNKTVSKWKINTYKSPDGEITMTMEDARKILTQMVNRYNGVSSPVRLTNLRGKPDYENKKPYIFEIKDKLIKIFGSLSRNHINKENNGKATGKVEKQSFGKMLMEKFDRYWDKKVKNFNAKIKYELVNGGEGRFHNIPKADRAHFFMG